MENDDDIQGLDADPLDWRTAQAVRAATGLEIAAFARAVGVSRRTVNRWEQPAELTRGTRCTGAARVLMVLIARNPSARAALTQEATT